MTGQAAEAYSGAGPLEVGSCAACHLLWFDHSGSISLTPRAVLETLSGLLMLDVHLPLADGRELVLPRYTQPEPEQRLVLEKLGWELPAQPPPRIRAPQLPATVKGRETKSKM